MRATGKRIDRSKLTAAFKALRQMGYIARQNFSCCGGCAGYEIATYFDSLPADKASKIRGCVTYNRQAAMDLEDSDGMWLSYGQIETASGKASQLTTSTVGVEVLNALTAAGLKAEWDGNPDTRIFIHAEDPDAWKSKPSISWLEARQRVEQALRPQYPPAVAIR